MNQRNHWVRLLALLLSFGLVAAACGDSSDDTGGSDATTDEEETAADGDEEGEGDGAGAVDQSEAAEAVAESAEEDGSEPASSSTATSMEELEAEWAASRQEQIDMLTAGIESGEFGIGDDNILRGTGGFTIDLNACPSDWSETEGIGEEIKVGYTGPESGNLAAYGNQGVGWETYIDYVNENGGIGGTPVELIKRDDQYQATLTIEMVDELLQADKPFAFHTLGTPSVLATYDTLNDKCVPQLLSATGHPAWGDPIEHPWTTGSILGYLTEGILWGAWINENMSDQLPVTVAGLVMDNDFGLAYVLGLEKYMEENPGVIEEFVQIRFDPAAPTVTNEVTTITAAEPDVVMAMMAGNPCLLTIEDAARSGLKDSGAELFMPSVCVDPSFLVPAGEAADGWRIVGGGQKAGSDPQWADDPWVSFANQLTVDAGLDPTIGLYFTGMFYAHAFIEILRVANELPDGLTRTNVMLATRSLSYNHPNLLEGVNFSMNGNEDAYFIEGSQFSQWDADLGSWVQIGGIVDLNGSSPNCNWSDTGCS